MDGRRYGARARPSKRCRTGEVIALQRQNVRASHLHVRHSYNGTLGLKETKAGRVRNVALIPVVKTHLDEVLKGSPFKAPDAVCERIRRGNAAGK